MIKGLGKHLLTYSIPCLMAASFITQLGVQIHRNGQYRDLGEGYRVRETASERIFALGNGRFCKDDNMDDLIDKTLINLPVSPMMGGPGYVSQTVQTTAEDQRRFERANILLKSHR